MTTRHDGSQDLPQPWAEPWPEEGLERLGCCPVCGSTEKTVLHANLVDEVFRVASGLWTLWRCEVCRSGYLDPRPSREAIHIAYENYYTHLEVVRRDHSASLSPFRNLYRYLVNSYINWRYSTQTLPSSIFGVLIVHAMPSLKRMIDRRYRHMPRIPKGGGRLLDVGCGDGSFLSIARACGWDIVGLDPDPKAAANATKKDLIVYKGGIEYFDSKTELFDVITLNHVIEHVHDPVRVLKTCHALLKPGGQLWLETPNIDSFGHARFQRSWRGLEIPRHLVIFNLKSLVNALLKTEFINIVSKKTPSPLHRMIRASLAIKEDLPLDNNIQLSIWQEWDILKARLWLALMPSRKEFLTVIAQKINLQGQDDT